MLKTNNHFIIEAYGHQNITAKHSTTWQLTKEKLVTKHGDCIIGINSTASTLDLPKWLKSHLQKGGIISIKLIVNDNIYTGIARGHPNLTFSDKKDIVFRKSDFISSRTIAINCSFAAIDLPKSIVTMLRNTGTRIKIQITKLL